MSALIAACDPLLPLSLASAALLHPERESTGGLAETRATIDEYNFAGQYQQVPAQSAVAWSSWSVIPRRKGHAIMTLPERPSGEFTWQRRKLLNINTVSGLQSRVRRFDSDPGLHLANAAFSAAVCRAR